jgi:hypothetical protein
MSINGASLEVASPYGIPDNFALLIRPEIIKRSCQVAWRDAKRIGVRFTQFASVGGLVQHSPLSMVLAQPDMQNDFNEHRKKPAMGHC